MHKFDTDGLSLKANEIVDTLKIDNQEQKDATLWYTEAFIQDSDPDDVARYTPDVLGQYIQTSLEFLKKRGFGQASVRVHSPEKYHGEAFGRTIIEVVTDDMPFLVDSVTQFLAERDIDIIDFFHPVCRVKRDKEGNFISFSDLQGKFDGLPESVMQLHIPRLPTEAAEKEFTDIITRILVEVRKATGDWQVMMRRLDNIISDFTAQPVPVDHNHLLEVTGFLRWLGNNHFTFLGFREYRYDQNNNGRLAQVPDSGLGLFRDPHYYVLRQDGDYVDMFDDLKDVGQDSPVTIIKTNRKTNVHRFAHMDQIFVTIFEQGEAVGQYCFIGLFTSTAYSARTKNIPILSQKVHEIMRRSGFRPTGHDGKTLTHILDTYPRDELFQTNISELYDIVMGIMKVEIRPTIRLFSRYDRFERFISAMVYIPRERLNTDARSKVGALLASAFGGRLSTFSLWFGENNYVRIKYIIATSPNTILRPDHGALEAEIKRITANWSDSVRESMYGLVEDTDIGRLVRDYADGFPASYRETHNALDAVRDIKILEDVREAGEIIPHIEMHEDNAHENHISFRLFSPKGALPLSDCLPIFENFGFRVLTENPHAITVEDKKYYLHEFVNAATMDGDVDFDKVKSLLSEAFLEVYYGRVENDSLNRLIIASNLGARHVSVLRAFSRYLKQAGILYSQKLISECLVKNPTISSKLYEMFDVLHNPAHDLSVEERQEKSAALKQDILDLLKDVSVLDEDTIIRRMMNAIRSVLRTNKFCKKDYFSFKFDCAKLHDLPLPRPYREIWVYSPEVEGVHLRFGKVARGGLRWSDRQEDFRTEILGLVKAQQVKNAVIVPVGAKGGFFAKKLPDMLVAGREAWMEAGISAYKTFISSLLDITDNIVQGNVVPPENVVRLDEDDPYLVVAADKGTATFSDIANSLSLERNFWLGDAFASGGSVGYDHKKMGITARGAWEAVKRHFREIGKDIQSEEFSVIGVGDMSGDVFGNGMLLSRKINLVAAFDHRDIFIDPTPIDTEKNYAERQRLFNMQRSTWQDYNQKLMSQGGGIFSRKAKSITLTPEIKVLTGLAEDAVTPNELIGALLKAQIDLLWFGGIGTYIKAKSERHSQVGDKANDSIRINADELRAKVIGEGANLGLTQKGRIEFALGGGAINTDAVDNSAGVDCSDHEVNIKIALGHAMTEGKLTPEDRITLLSSMTDEVAELVLQTNYDQTGSLTVTQTCASERLQIHARFLNYLEKHADLNRDVEVMPDEKTILAGRSGFNGLTRPELSVMMAYSKLHLYKVVLESKLPDEPFLEKIVNEYMPNPVEGFESSLDAHPLRREIITTVITNRVINEGGITFIFRLCERLNVTPEQAMYGYLVARNIIGMDDLLDGLSALDNKVPANLQVSFYEILRKTLFDQTRRVLVNFPNEIEIKDVIGKYAGEFQHLSENIESTLGQLIKGQFKDFVSDFKHAEMPEVLCKRICALYFLKNGCDAIDLANITGKDATDMARLYFNVVEIVGLDELRRKATEIPLSDVYDQKALSQIITEMDTAMYDLVEKIAQSKMSPDEWFKNNHKQLVKYKETFNDAVAVSVLGLSRLSIIAAALRDLGSNA